LQLAFRSGQVDWSVKLEPAPSRYFAFATGCESLAGRRTTWLDFEVRYGEGRNQRTFHKPPITRKAEITLAII
jgi:hypothetical protein